MGVALCKSEATGPVPVGPDGEVDQIVPVPDMPIDGGECQVKMPDGQIARFVVPAGYKPGGKVVVKYKPLPKAKAKPKAKPAVKPAGRKAIESGAAVGSPPPSQAASSSSPAPASTEGPPTTTTTTVGSEVPLVPPPTGSAAALLSDSKGPIDVKIKMHRPLLQGFPELPDQLPRVNGSWDWIRTSNDEIHRLTRLDAGELLQETFKKGGFSWKEDTGLVHKVPYKSITKMVQGTRILTYSNLPPLPPDPGYTMEVEHGRGISCIEKAETMALQQPPLKPVTVNAASAFHAGGGFTSGGRHALEEAFCSQSTLYMSLQKAVQDFEQGVATGKYERNDPVGHHRHIPVDGCIFSPCVEIFRGGTDLGYHPHTRTVQVAAVVSVAMYNKNRHVRDAPVDAPSNEQEYEDGVLKKFTTMIHAAALAGADSMIIPDVGCGVFQNDPSICGRILGKALQNYRTRFKRVVFTGNEKFFNAASDYLEAQGARPISATMSKRLSTMAPVTENPIWKVPTCYQCKKSLQGADFKNLCMLIDTTHNSNTLRFLHKTCGGKRPRDKKFTVMGLPDVTKNPESFLRALDLDGNGVIEKAEVRCIIALVWDGDLSKDSAAFEEAFKKRWEAWDADRSNHLNLKEVKAEVKWGLDEVPQSLIQYVQELASKKVGARR